MSQVRYVFFVWVLIDKFKEWTRLLKGFSWKQKNYDAVFYVLFDFSVYFYLAIPILILIPLIWGGSYKQFTTLEFMAMCGALFGFFTHLSVWSKNISEYYEKKINNSPSLDNDKS